MAVGADGSDADGGRVARGEARHGGSARRERPHQTPRRFSLPPARRREGPAATGRGGKMKMPGAPYRLPPDKKEKLERAKRLEWVTIFFMLTIIAAISLTMGASQTMKAMWTEDVLSLVPPVAFLFGTRYFDRPPDDTFPYGYRRAVMTPFLAAAVALLGFGLYIFIDSVVKLVMAEAPTIQTVGLFGRRVWLG